MISLYCPAIFEAPFSSILFPNPQVIVMSATMDVDLFSQYFNKAPVLYLEGRQHQIQIYYTKQPQSDYLHAALVSIFQIHQVSHFLTWTCIIFPIS